MSKVDVLRELFDWSLGRPRWQRDALRRLTTRSELGTTELQDLAELCKTVHGLGNGAVAEPLEKKHLSQRAAKHGSVTLHSLTHHSGVNALAQDQTIEFGDGLTIIYGGNAAGKSGYTRILKRACRARGSEEILGNVIAGTALGRPSATIKYSSRGRSQQLLWEDEARPDSPLSNVSVFDHHCASVYISEQTDVAFRPLGLDLFDKLSSVCEGVRRVLEQERRSLVSTVFQFPEVAHGTVVYALINNLTSLTGIESVKEIAELSDEQSARVRELKVRIRDLSQEDTERAARMLELRARRVRALVDRLENVSTVLSDSRIAALFAGRDRMDEAIRVAEESRRSVFSSQPLRNTGSDTWRALWNAAARFSTTDAYPVEEFPFIGVGSRCPLCQAELTEESTHRLHGFQEFLRSLVQRGRDEAVKAYDRAAAILDGVVIWDETARQALDELQFDRPDLAAEVREYLDGIGRTYDSVRTTLSRSLTWSEETFEYRVSVDAISRHVSSLEEGVEALRGADKGSTLTDLRRELEDLEARQTLADNLQGVFDEIERKKQIAAYQLCIEETRTNAITRKSTEVTERAVTEQLTRSFQKELKALRFYHVEVEMVSAGGSRGALYHRLQLKRAPGVSLPKIVSEGEARCLSVASFFAELTTASDRSAILFDDPVSSLDHNWRGNVATRLVVESKSRQVIVFSHDIVFLLSLLEEAESRAADVKHQCLRRDRYLAGLSSQQLPWVAMKVTKRIGFMNELWQAADKRCRKGEQTKYEENAAHIYGLLRESWERAVEEVLLAGTVERYRNSVQTLRVRHLADITDADCSAVQAGMARCSRWLTGHDQSVADNAPIPGPTELKADIQELQDWVKSISVRRRNR